MAPPTDAGPGGKAPAAFPAADQDLPALRQALERFHLPEDVQQHLIRVVMQSHSGPLPPADAFREYGQTDPRAPGLILDMAERQQRHDHWMDKGVLISETTYRILGILVAAMLVGGMTYGAVLCALAGHASAAVALGAASGLSAVAGVFIRGRDMARIRAEEPAPAVPVPSVAALPSTPARQRPRDRRR